VREQKCTKGFWWGNLTERDHLEDLGINGRIMDHQDIRWGPWSGFIWLRTGAGGGLL